MNEFKIFLLIVGGTCQKQSAVPIICEVNQYQFSGIRSRPLDVILPWRTITETEIDKTWVGVYE